MMFLNISKLPSFKWPCLGTIMEAASSGNHRTMAPSLVLSSPGTASTRSTWLHMYIYIYMCVYIYIYRLILVYNIWQKWPVIRHAPWSKTSSLSSAAVQATAGFPPRSCAHGRDNDLESTPMETHHEWLSWLVASCMEIMRLGERCVWSFLDIGAQTPQPSSWLSGTRTCPENLHALNWLNPLDLLVWRQFIRTSPPRPISQPSQRTHGDQFKTLSLPTTPSIPAKIAFQSNLHTPHIEWFCSVSSTHPWLVWKIILHCQVCWLQVTNPIAWRLAKQSVAFGRHHVPSLATLEDRWGIKPGLTGDFL